MLTSIVIRVEGKIERRKASMEKTLQQKLDELSKALEPVLWDLLDEVKKD
jgi:hypothetical protein